MLLGNFSAVVQRGLRRLCFGSYHLELGEMFRCGAIQGRRVRQPRTRDQLKRRSSRWRARTTGNGGALHSAFSGLSDVDADRPFAAVAFDKMRRRRIGEIVLVLVVVLVLVLD